jgi:hypothetical protein
MNKIILVFISYLIIFQQNSIAEKKHEGGLFVGTSYYLGEINPSRQFYAPSLAVGAMYKLSLNKRDALRIHAYYGQFRGSDRDFNNQYQQNRNVSFSASLLDINAIFEYNFLPIHFNARQRAFSPFLFVGLGYEFILQSQNNIGNHFAVPFGVGVKYLVSKKVTVGAEWSFRKTFRDNIDGLENPGETKYKSSISNTDWYSFAGFFITFRLFDHSGDCPAYR